MTAKTSTTITWQRGEDDIIVLTLDDPQQTANTMNDAYLASMDATLDRLAAERESIVGVIITSAKKTFFAGGDLNDLITITTTEADAFRAFVRRLNAQLRSLETLGVPVVAAVNGTALGGGLEISLACHARIVADNPSLRLGMPEVTLGLMPGAGGIARSVRLLGILPALLQLLLEGKSLDPSGARELGIIDEVVPESQLLASARAWIAANPSAVQPWDAPGFRIPGGMPSDAAFAANLPAFPATLRKQLKGANYPAPHHILAAAVEGAQVDFENATVIETRYFVDLVIGQVSKNMIQAFFFDMQRANGDRGRPNGDARFVPAKIAVLGAGMMGAAIAYVAAKAGIDVVLKDVSQDRADLGKGYSEKLVAKDVERGRTTSEVGTALLNRITATDDPAQIAGADLVVEAVFEDPAVKAAVYSELDPYLTPDTVVASNTSTLPITELGGGVTNQANFIGMHFFSPVEKMPLLEIIRGNETDDATLARALDVARVLRKTPIVVKDSRGFFTSRVIETFLKEALAMVGERIPASSVEQASSQAGYPSPALQLCDELNLQLLRRIRDANRDAMQARGGVWVPHPSEVVIERMLEEFGRPGRTEGAGFYEYVEGKRVALWPGLVDAFGGDARDTPFDDLKERLLFIEALEAVRCVDEGVIESVADANIGSILGIGFPGWTGGVLQYINGYAGGVAGFVVRARELAGRYGERFTPPDSLIQRAELAEPFSNEPSSVSPL